MKDDIHASNNWYSSTTLHLIAEVGNEKILALLLFHKADVTLRDKHGHTALTLAQANRRVDCVEMIQNELELRQQVRQETEKRLLDACFDGDVVKAEECLAQLGAHAKAVLNASPNGSDTLNFLYRACRTGNVALVRLLLQHGAIAKPHRQTSYSPLYIACRIGNLEIVQMLLAHFSHLVSVATLEQILPLAAACSQGHLAIVQFLLTYPNYPYTSCNVYVDRLQRSYIFPFNLNAQDLNEQTCLYLAVIGGHVDVVKYLLSYRVRALTQNEVDSFKRRSPSLFRGGSNIATARSRAVTTQPTSSSSSSFSVDIGKNRIRSVTDSTTNSEFCLNLNLPTINFHSEEILSKSNGTMSTFSPFNLDIYSINGRTALHEAVEQENLQLVHLLVTHGANVNLPFEEIASRTSQTDEQCFITRSTALSSACRHGNVPLIEYLLNSMATDKDFLAFNVCLKQSRSDLIGHLLKYRALPDNEFKITKRQLTSTSLYGFDDEFWNQIDMTTIWNGLTTATATTTTVQEKKDDNNNNLAEPKYSSQSSPVEPVLKRRSSKRYQILTTSFEQIKNRFTVHSSSSNPIIQSSTPIPSIPVGIQWHRYGPLKSLDPLWFIQAVIFVNKDTFLRSSDITRSNRHLLFHCITRIDLSDNSLESLPSFLLQMYSLKILNVSNNQLSELPTDTNLWSCHQLIELDLSHNALRSLPAAIFQLRSLQRAYAAHNQLQFLPVEMWSSTTLTDFNVANNSLKELPAPNGVILRNAEKTGRHMSSRHTGNQTRTTSEFRPQLSLVPPAKLNIIETKPPTISSSMTTTNLSIFSSWIPSGPSRSTTFTQLATNDTPNSPDDDDELERRSKLKAAYQNSLPSTLPAPNITITPVKRLCLWENHIANPTDEDQQQPSGGKLSSSFSRLNNLNLSHNRFETLPPMLCCLAPYLTSLNFSHNLLVDPSCISYYPSRLKMLDLSFNRLQRNLTYDLPASISSSRREKLNRKARHSNSPVDETSTTTNTKYNQSTCFRPEIKETNSQADAKRRRSRSVSRHKLLASATFASATSTSGANTSTNSDTSDRYCIHRRHTKLEFLNDLNLSDNAITDLMLSSLPKISPNTDITELRSSLLFPAVTRLNLSQNQLVSIPPTISLLENLGTLILRDNRCLKEIPLSIGSMQKLWNLDLHGCCGPAGK